MVKILKSKKVVIGLAIVLVITIAIVAGQSGTDVQLESVKRGNMREYVSLRGKVSLDKNQKIYSQLSGIIDEVIAVEGDAVDTQSQLVKIDVEDLDLALQRAHASYTAAKASLAELKGSIKPEQIKQAEAQLEQAKILEEAANKDFEYKQEQLEKARTLYESEAVSAQELKDIQMIADIAKDTLRGAQESTTQAQYNLDLLRKGVSSSAIQVAEANVKQAELQIKELESNIGKATVYSPIEGTVLVKYAEKGMAVTPGAPLYEIGDYQSAFISVNVLVEDMSGIEIGQKAVLYGEILDDKELEGTIYYIAPKAESSISSLGVEQQKVEMKISYDNSEVNLRPGYGLDVDIIRQENKNALYVPEEAVFDMDGEDYVFVVEAGKLALRKIVTGLENEDYIEIVEGLAEDEKIVLDPESDLKVGMKVKE